MRTNIGRLMLSQALGIRPMSPVEGVLRGAAVVAAFALVAVLLFTLALLAAIGG